MTAPDGGDRIARVLAAQGVRFLFTLCGGHISPILVGAKRHGIRVVDVRHEATAVFAADAVARLTGVPGVAAVTAGPGVTNTMTAVENARLAQSPVVLLGGAAATILKGRGALQDIDQLSFFRSRLKWATSAPRVRDLAPTVARAFAVAREGVPGPVFVECPVDALYGEALVREWFDRSGGGAAKGVGRRVEQAYIRRYLNRLFEEGGSREPGRPAAPVVLRAPDGAVRRASERLAAAERPVMLVGSQAMLRTRDAEATAAAVARIGVPVYLSGMARGLLGAGHPLQLRHRRRQALREADLVLLAGVPCDFRLEYGRHIRRRATLVSANRDRGDLRRNRRPDVEAHGDPSDFLSRLAELAGPRGRWDPWLAALRARDEEREREIVEQAGRPADHINPLALLRVLDGALADDSVLVLDGGDFVATASYVARPRRPLSFLDPGPYGTLGVGAGFALGAKLCRPDAEVWIVYGDGSAAFSIAEFDTFVRHGIPVAAVVGNDASWAQIARGQEEMLADDVGTVLRHTDYHRVAEGFGGRGHRVETLAEFEAAIGDAKRDVAGGAPVLINAIIGPTDFRSGSLSM